MTYVFVVPLLVLIAGLEWLSRRIIDEVRRDYTKCEFCGSTWLPKPRDKFTIAFHFEGCPLRVDHGPS
jgi:hypothetical protein